MAHRLYWGDLHNHNSVGLFHYSKGSLERTIDIARSHLDFFAFTGHSHQHDMPVMPNDGHLKWREGFEHHTQEWPNVDELQRTVMRLPVDQRYTDQDIDETIAAVREVWACYFSQGVQFDHRRGP